ncbi:MAG: hypothetical protein RR280_05990 [Bacteroidaceae bacterium]
MKGKETKKEKKKEKVEKGNKVLSDYQKENGSKQSSVFDVKKPV